MVATVVHIDLFLQLFCDVFLVNVVFEGRIKEMCPNAHIGIGRNAIQ